MPDSGQPWDEFEIETARHDRTGDGAEDLVKWSSCPTTTSSNPIWVLVYDGTSAADSQPKLIGKLGNYDYFKSMQISLKGQAVTLLGKSLGANDPRCCPSQMLKLTYRWDGGKFVEQSVR